ncbi:hypothetical protein [Azospirillum endophyticum]
MQRTVRQTGIVSLQVGDPEKPARANACIFKGKLLKKQSVPRRRWL